MSVQKGCYPKFENMIAVQSHLNSHFRAAPRDLIIRHYSECPVRGRVFERDGFRLATSDNEACASFYEQVYSKTYTGGNLWDFFEEKNLRLAFRIDELEAVLKQDSEKASTFRFNPGMCKGSPFRSKFGLKLSHAFPAAEDVSGISLSARSFRFLSPFNILLTPKTLRNNKGSTSGFKHELLDEGFELYRKDVGETPQCIEVLHDLLRVEISKLPRGAEVFDEYLKICEAPDQPARHPASDTTIQIRFSAAQTPHPQTSKPVEQSGATLDRRLAATWEGFESGSNYSLGEILEPLGIDNYQPAIHVKNGQVSLAKFNLITFNSGFPSEVGIHTGDRRIQAASAWINGNAIPVFAKHTNHERPWYYYGQKSVAGYLEGSAARDYASSRGYPDHAKIHFILFLEDHDEENGI